MVGAAESDVLVIGAGVAGLTTAVRLAEARLSVRVVADLPSSATTSAAAGASWGPYLVSDPRVPHWSEQTRLSLEKLAEDSHSGVHLARGVEASREPVEPPAWLRGIGDFELCRPEELPADYVCGWRYTAPLVDMPRYLGFLVRRLAALGVVIEQGRVTSFAEVADRARVLVNCTGLGARTLVPDDQLQSVRGQVVVIDNPGIDTFFQDYSEREELTYYLPHGDQVVLGGCALPFTESLEPDPASTLAILDRCAAVEPRLRGATVREVRVGLRPIRPGVRVEWGRCDGVLLIHNYGHGGAGITLSWGCADEVLTLSGLQ